MPDAFGLRSGSNVSKAAALAARPSGATMGELIDATGDTQYNVFRRLEERGFKVRREGRGRALRIWLSGRADQANQTPVEDDEEQEALEATPNETIERLTFSLERDLQRALRASLNQLEDGLEAIDGGRENSFRDVTAKDKSGNVVVIELKAVKAGADAVAQLLAYMGEVKAAQAPSGTLRGILIAPDFHVKTLSAASMVPNIELKRYKFHLTFEDA